MSLAMYSASVCILGLTHGVPLRPAGRASDLEVHAAVARVVAILGHPDAFSDASIGKWFETDREELLEEELLKGEQLTTFPGYTQLTHAFTRTLANTYMHSHTRMRKHTGIYTY